MVCDANELPCFASGPSGILASYVPGPGASLGTESSARFTFVPKPPAPICCDLLNDLLVCADSVDASYGLYALGSPTSLSETSALRSDFDLKAAEAAVAAASFFFCLMAYCRSLSLAPFLFFFFFSPEIQIQVQVQVQISRV